MKRRLLLGARIFAGIAALVVAAGLAVFVGDVLAADSTLKRDDLRFSVAPDSRGLWKVGGRTPALKTILDIRDDLAWRRAAQAFQLSRARANIAYDPTRTSSRAETQAALASAETYGLTRRQASALANFTAILAYEEAAGDPQNGPALVRRSSSEFRRAIRLDRANDEAKFNLELLLELQESDEEQRRDQAGAGTGGENAVGAAAQSEGKGY